MKYFNYFKKKMEESFKDVAVVGSNVIEFTNGEFFEYDYAELDGRLDNNNYKTEIYNMLKEIKQMRELPDDTLTIVFEKIKESIPKEFVSLRLINGDDTSENDTLVLISHDGKSYSINLKKKLIVQDDFINKHLHEIINQLIALRMPQTNQPEVTTNEENGEA